MRISRLAIVALFVVNMNAFADQNKLQVTHSEPRTQGTSLAVDSTIFDESRIIDIYVPEGYEHSHRRYPVIYVMDSDYLFDMTVAIAKNRWSRDLAPQSIIVGLAARNNHERFDYAMPMLRDDGGVSFADSKPQIMSAFLTSELIPYIDGNYRTNGYQVLIGMSPTSTNVIYDYLSASPVFDAHIAIAADLQMKSLKGEPLNLAIAEQGKKRKDGFIVASRAATDLQNDPSREAFFQYLINFPNADELGIYRYLPVETEHYSVALSTIDFAFEKLFPLAQWRPNYRALRNAEKPVTYLKAFYEDLSTKVGFQTYPTVDGYWMGNSILGLSRALGRNDKLPQAIEVLKWADEQLPNNTWINHYLSRVYARMNNVELALHFAQKTVKLGTEQQDVNLAIFIENRDTLLALATSNKGD